MSFCFHLSPSLSLFSHIFSSGIYTLMLEVNDILITNEHNYFPWLICVGSAVLAAEWSASIPQTRGVKNLHQKRSVSCGKRSRSGWIVNGTAWTRAMTTAPTRSLEPLRSTPERRKKSLSRRRRNAWVRSNGRSTRLDVRFYGKALWSGYHRNVEEMCFVFWWISLADWLNVHVCITVRPPSCLQQPLTRKSISKRLFHFFVCF